MITPVVQPQFTSVLQYFQKGDFSVFKKACELAGMVPSSNNPYFFSNLFLASQIGGLIEVSEVESSIRWWVAFDSEIKIQSEFPKVIGTEEHWFKAHVNKVSTIIADESDRPLLLGKYLQNTSEVRPFFGKSFSKRIPTFSAIESEVLIEESQLDLSENRFEIFDPLSFRWVGATGADSGVKGLIRIRKKFGGMRYLIVHQELDLAFKVLNPEWMHYLASNILNWNMEKIISFDESSIRFPRQFRLPNVLYRFLFANSQFCRLGSYVEFKAVHPEIMSWVIQHFITEKGIYGV